MRRILPAVTIAAMLASCGGQDTTPDPAPPQDEAAFLADAAAMLPADETQDAPPADPASADETGLDAPD
ncbi:hypothetical protein [Croceicoccus hydrothermalis]|uniref:hypothetical protein n=1 Tax=Croceicoccus hydrothermalis TaxID=2867964 RepID=UPI001EFBBFCE|nr:hypothetical protein [Croceicoccus hydrothermalis]